MEDWQFYVAISVLIAGFGGSFFMLSTTAKDDNVQQAVTVAATTTIVCMIVFAAVAFWYFTQNPQYGYPYLLLTNTVSLILAAGALAVSSINVQWVA